MDCYKAYFVAKDFSQTYGVDYFETFFLATSLNTICILFSLAVNLDLLIFQLDAKNDFLYGN